MSTTGSTFVAALLYSRTVTQTFEQARLLAKIRDVIKSDRVLRKQVHQINVDDEYSRDLLWSNASGVIVDKYPVFVYRSLTEDKPVIIQLEQVNDFFEHIYHTYYSIPGNEKTSPYIPQINLLSPFFDLVEEPPSSSSSSNDEEETFDWAKHHDKSSSSSEEEEEKYYHQKKGSDTSAMYRDERSSEKNQTIVSWNLASFPADGSGKEVWLQLSDELTISSNDGLQHSLILTDSNWRTFHSTLYPTTSNLSTRIPIELRSGCYYLMDGCYPERGRLKISVVSSKVQPEVTMIPMVQSGRDRIGSVSNNYVFTTNPSREPYQKISYVKDSSIRGSTFSESESFSILEED